MIINRVELAGYDYNQVNSDYFFEPGLNMVIGDQASGKTTILNSIISGFSAETFHEYWRGYDTRHNLSGFYPNQEPIIKIQFQSGGVTYCLTKKIKKEGVECQLGLVNEQDVESFVCEGAEAIERIKQYSREIIYFTRTAMSEISESGGIFIKNVQSLTEYELSLNTLLKRYGYGIWPDLQVKVVDGKPIITDKDSRNVHLGGGAISFLSIMSVIASLKMNESHPILIIDDFCRMLDNSQIDGVRQCLSEVLDSQVIVTLDSMRLCDFEMESNMIQLSRHSSSD